MPQPFADQFRSIPMSSSLGESLERARRFAREQGHRAVTLEHLLLAFTEDPDASSVLQASTVDLVRLGTDVSGYLGRLLEDMRAENGAEPQTDPELLRVLHAAVQAAQQSRRRHIDGAIVLAAVVGDGKSPAAGLLKSHGLTFEEAIRALQKANAKANAQARSKKFASPAPSASAPAPAPPIEDENSPSANLEPLDPNEAQGSAQSVEDILAAARARIQQRTAAIVGKSAGYAGDRPPPVEPEPPQLEAAPAPAPPAFPEADELAEETEIPAPPGAPPAFVAPQPLPPPSPPSSGGPGWTPPTMAGQGQPSQRLPQPPPQPSRQPPQQRLPQPDTGPPRPPLPHHAGPSSLPPQPGLPNRRPRAPWPDAGELAPHARLPAANGAMPEGAAPVARRPGQRTGGQAGQGPLVETIPRRMRLGMPASAQVRIGRDRIDGLILLLMKARGMAYRPDALVARALSVRLRAPDGGFWIEADSPEAQWVETSSSHHHDDHLSWRWTVTPQRRGRARLVLVVAARTVGRDGLVAETAPPDRAIEVTVTGGRLRRLMRWGGFLAALILGAMLGRFGSEFWALATAIVRQIAGK